MKRVLPGLLAIVIAASLSAFTAQKQHAKLTGEKWFVFNGTSPADLNDASKYSLDGSGATNTVCPSDAPPYRCEILAKPQSGNPSRPDLSTIINEMTRNNP